MKLIFGLGNPGKKYEKTRHNVGFLFLDYLTQKYEFSDFKNISKLKAEIAEGSIENQKVLLIKPQTFMNLSGQTIQAVSNFYKTEKEDSLVVYDDKDMEFGKIRFRKTGSSGGHNGIKSIISVFGEEFQRIKVGVQNDLITRQETSDFVLSNFQKEEINELESVFERCTEILNLIFAKTDAKT